MEQRSIQTKFAVMKKVAVDKQSNRKLLQEINSLMALSPLLSSAADCAHSCLEMLADLWTVSCLIWFWRVLLLTFVWWLRPAGGLQPIPVNHLDSEDTAVKLNKMRWCCVGTAAAPSLCAPTITSNTRNCLNQPPSLLDWTISPKTGSFVHFTQSADVIDLIWCF